MKRKYQFLNCDFEISLIDFTIEDSIKLIHYNNMKEFFFQYNYKNNEICILNLNLEYNEIEILKNVCKELVNEK